LVYITTTTVLQSWKSHRGGRFLVSLECYIFPEDLAKWIFGLKFSFLDDMASEVHKSVPVSQVDLVLGEAKIEAKSQERLVTRYSPREYKTAFRTTLRRLEASPRSPPRKSRRMAWRSGQGTPSLS
jgi:hypothetical protein